MSTMKPWKWIVTAICLFLMFFNFVLPPIGGFTAAGTSVICIFAGTIGLFVTVNVMWPVMLCLLAFACSGLYSLTQVTQMAMGNNIFWFVAFNGMIISVLIKTGVLRRIAIWLVTRKFTKKSPWLFIGSLFMAVLLMGAFMDPTGVMMLFIAIAEAVFGLVGIKKGSRFGELVVMGIMLFIGLSCGITPIGHTVPLLMISYFEDMVPISIGQWSIAGVAVALVVFILFMLALKFIYRLDVSAMKDFDPTTALAGQANSGPMSKAEKVSLVLYGVVIFLWLAPSILKGILPGVASFIGGLGTIMPCMLGVALLCLVPVEDGKPLVSMNELLTDGCPWAACFPCAVCMLFGAAIQHPDVAIPDSLSALLGPAMSSISPIVFMLVLALICICMTNLTSNTVSDMVTGTVALVLMSTGTISGINAAGMGFILGNCATLSYATAAGSAYAAVVTGSGWVRTKSQVGEGLLYAVIGMLLMCTLGYALVGVLCG